MGFSTKQPKPQVSENIILDTEYDFIYFSQDQVTQTKVKRTNQKIGEKNIRYNQKRKFQRFLIWDRIIQNKLNPTKESQQSKDNGVKLRDFRSKRVGQD
jgi:hypothetical protein